ncbi:hypothetical protein [Pseudomonas mosselii]|uniref:hypothetical protein n=1 Tax=Pseudomonas mosselii TaxID=78327 RepID=UPI001A9DB39B|nr:hypothetical protein [Pseudomonas mosselii]MCH7418657.1 hypothetical protein [Pseudomonas mosselii]MCL8300047.1 hypothetical protein [Pseudomonas mosselii]MCL8339876.1 hypothetical protein [Pseudomonas mosselii]MCU9531617.1 hypothetical protein [Pseudomonas mosselii]MCU9538885.1 hypothetical protein [Pseudomonas mosselii]
MLPLLSRFLLHALACVAFPFLLSLGFDLYRQHVGPPMARGVSVGLATMMVFYAFVLFNLLMVVIPRATIRYGLALLLVLLVLAFFNTLHPLRALGFAVLCGGLCAAAISMTPAVTSLLNKCRK